MRSPRTHRLTTDGVVPRRRASSLSFHSRRLSWRPSQTANVSSDIENKVLDTCVRWVYIVSMQHTAIKRYRATTIAELIRAQGRSVAWLARQLGLSRPYTSDIVHGHVEISEQTAERIATLLMTSLFLAFTVSNDTYSTPIGKVA